MTLDESRLAVRIRAGDCQAFRDLYDAFGARVLGYCLRLSGCREEAEDLVQEVFVAAYTGRAAFRGEARLISWLLGIATRRWRDRRRQARPSAADTFDVSDVSDEGRRPGVEQGVLDGLVLAQALAALEPAFREALLLVRSQGLTYAEAAQVMGQPEGTVKWRVSEAAKKVQRMLHVSEYDEGRTVISKERTSPSCSGTVARD